MRAQWILAIVALVVGAFLATLLLAPGPTATDDPLPPASTGESAAPSPGVERLGPFPGTLAMDAGYCLFPVTGCQDGVGQQWTDVRLAPAPGAGPVDLWLNWTPSSQAATGLQLSLITCGQAGGCGSGPPVLARASGGATLADVGANPQSIHLHADLTNDRLAESLFARVTSSTAGQDWESTPHASLQQDFTVAGTLLRIR
ncbi:MAG: hypothetical protein QOE90_1692 [Thermoplasmata archaeon]|nr:hypothetical protein [Thermoplasmata archaeon]